MGAPAHDDQGLRQARLLLERGDYRGALALLEPLAEAWPVTLEAGAELRLLMATAHQGLGQRQQAVACCRAAAAGGSGWRRQSEAVLEILEAPELRRPAEWGLTLPRLEDAAPLEGRRGGGGARRSSGSPPPAAPVGRTRAPVGFALVATALLLLLTVLLAGCLRIETTLEFPAPGRVRLEQQLLDASGRELRDGMQTVAVLTPRQLRQRLTSEAERAAMVLGRPLPPPELDWHERNWLVGVWQQIELRWDLSSLDPVAGLELPLHLRPLTAPAVRLAEPIPTDDDPAGGRLWQLQPGAVNRLQLACWRWSALGLGAVAIGAAVLLVLVLQRLLPSANG
ncbi:MAG: DUF3153 domain-containing protein [Synechococcus sp. Tobar2m-G35]|nr:DUF3153 domain-containing protein [Synechococcus sp. Tobar2m-G35]